MCVISPTTLSLYLELIDFCVCSFAHLLCVHTVFEENVVVLLKRLKIVGLPDDIIGLIKTVYHGKSIYYIKKFFNFYLDRP